MIRFRIFIFFLFLTHYSTAQYIENKGQWPENVLFGFSEDNINYYIEKDGITVDVAHPHDVNYNTIHASEIENHQVRKHAFKIAWTNSDFSSLPTMLDSAGGYKNYLCSSLDRPIHHAYYFNGFTLEDVWAGIDIQFLMDGKKLKYNYIVDPNRTAPLAFDVFGVDDIEIRDQEVHFKTSCGVVKESFPLVYSTSRPETNLPLTLNSSNDSYQISFPLTEEMLTIDPILEGASYVGATGPGYATGAGSNFFDNGDFFAITMMGGDDVNYPITLGSFNAPTTYTGTGFTRFNDDLTQLVWSTHIDEVGSFEIALASLVSGDEIVIVMASESPNSTWVNNATVAPLPPMVEEIPDLPFQWFLHLLVIKSDGSELLRRRCIGSISIDMFGQISNSNTGQRADISQTSDGDYVVVCTAKDENFPVTEGAYDSVNTGTNDFNQRDAAVFRVSQDLETLKWATLFGGNNYDYGFAIEVDANDNVYIGGVARINSLTVTPGAWSESISTTSSYAGYIAKFSSEGSLVASTAVNFPVDSPTLLPFGLAAEVVRFLEIDNDGNIWCYGYVSGNGSDIEITPGAYNVPNGSGFICKFNPDLSELLLSTRVGFDYGLDYDPTAFMIDNCGYIYTSACTSSSGVLVDAELTPDAISTQGGFYLTVYEPDLAGLHHASIFGGDHMHGSMSHFDKKGVVYQTVCVPPSETYFEATPGAWSTTQGTSFEMAAFKIDFQSQAATAIFSALLEGENDCPPYTLNLENYSTAGEYNWFLNGEPVFPEDGLLVLAPDVTGDIQIGLSVFNPESCNITDTVYKIIHLPQVILPQAAWDLQEPDLCNPSQALLEATFTGSGEFFEWSFDGTNFSDTLFLASIAEAGEYSLQLVASEAQCGLSDTLQYTFEYAPLVFETTSLLGDSCLAPTPFSAAFVGQGAAQLAWTLDGGAAGSNSGIDIDLAAGNHQISLTASSVLCGSQTQVWDVNILGSVDVGLATPTDITLCLGEATTLIGTTSQGTPTWEINGSQLAGGSLTITPQQATTALFIATDLESCNIADTAAVFISVVSPPAATFEFEKIDFPCKQRSEVVVGFTGSATTLLWDFGDGSTSSFADETHGYYTGDYQLTLTAFTPPCAPDQSFINIEVDSYTTGSGDIYPINIITPNADGINDCLHWESMQYDNITDFSISIFNRWGVLVYSSENGAFRWCPTDVEDGVYYYIMRWFDACEEKDGVLSGEVTIAE